MRAIRVVGRIGGLVAAVVGLALAAAADAGNPPPSPGVPQLEALYACRALADPQARLACYDARTEALANATASREVVVTDRAEIRKTRRGLFGFALPVTRLFGGGDGKEEKGAAEAEEVKQLDTTVASAHHARDGGWVITFAEGGTWEQIDSRSLALSPKPGQKALLKPGLLGSYFVEIDGQPGIKMRRVS